MKIGILRETRRWKDKRVAVTPLTAKKIISRWPGTEIYVQPSEIRAFSEKEYKEAGAVVKEDLSECNLLMGVKEVAEETLLEGKTYIMFAHVAKKQPHNRSFFRAMAEKKITLIDYEYFTGDDGFRLVAFGHWAGVAGACYAIKGMKKKFQEKDMPGPAAFYDAGELFDFLKHISIPPVKTVITGDGRVGQGTAMVLRQAGITEVSPDDFLSKHFRNPVFCILPFQDYVRPKPGSAKTYDDFFASPADFESTFLRFTRAADVYIPCHFWHPDSPVFFSAEDMASPDFTIRLIADISCDIPGPVAATLRTSEHDHPFYDVNRNTLQELPPFSGKDTITVVAVDNLPAALPRNASESFAEDLYAKIFPALQSIKPGETIERATILKKGTLTPRFAYLKDFLTA
jgi:saccharopine dehydrogenase (NAD+, L-lysine forming)